MSEFDDVLERLLVDPAFRAALAADPAGALTGYRLSGEELELLGSQLSTGDGEDRTVELRASKSSIFGLLSPLEGLVTGGGAGALPAGESFTPTGQHSGGAFQQLGDRLGSALGNQGPGGAAEGGASALPGPAESFGPPGAGESFGLPGTGDSSGGAAESLAGAAESFGGPSGEGVTTVPVGRIGGLMPSANLLPNSGDHVPAWYHPHVDADGDGHWDNYVAVQHADGSVDIYEDRNHDGLVDFIGHDRNADGIIDSADYDENFDGVADTHMTDTDGDGWMDTRTPINPQGS
jgi:hypothetical protein